MEHEYTVLGGINRARIGHYVGLVASAVSAVMVLLILSAVDLAKKFGLSANIPPSVLSLAGAGTVFLSLYWILDRYAWKWPVFSKFLKVPDLSGEWHCDGQTLNPDGSNSHQWSATVTIVQSWDRIRVRLKTAQSGSSSTSAALICDPVDGYRLFYSYKNDPRIGEAGLTSHRGSAEVTFAKDLLSAEGEYFNGYGRYTFGRMSLRRAEHG